MKLPWMLTFTLLAAAGQSVGQQKSAQAPDTDQLPYDEIPQAAEKYSAGAVAARLIDGTGFRFYWATEGLREIDLNFKPSTESRSALETITHIYEMSLMIKNATTHTVNTANQSPSASFNEMRKQALHNFKAAADILRSSTDEQLANYTLKFMQNEKLVEYPFWNQINGPISDCLWHIGQIVSYRRLSGNPFSDKVSLFSGTARK